MLKITRSTGFAANFEKTKSKANSDSVIGNSMVGGGEATNQPHSIKRKNQAKTTKSKILIKSKNHDFPPNSTNKEVGTGFFTPEARLALT